MQRRVAVFGMDNFSRKNRLQVEAMNARGYGFDVFTSDALGDSAANLPTGNSLHKLERRAWPRLKQIAAFLRLHRKDLNHVEVYPGGRFAGVYALAARVAGVPMMVIERGDLLYMDRYPRAARTAMRFCYRSADVIWCREFYQQRTLRKIVRARVFLLANAVRLPAVENLETPKRLIDFLWVNRLIRERKATWFVDILNRPEFLECQAYLLGVMPEAAVDEHTRAQQRYVVSRRPAHLHVGEYADPESIYPRARFFALPADVVFCNNALLEAMSHGVVPLVSDVEGARLIVEDGVDGFVFPHAAAGLEDAMRRALALDAATFAAMSRRAVEKVRNHYSLEQWAETLASEYAKLRRSADDMRTHAVPHERMVAAPTTVREPDR